MVEVSQLDRDAVTAFHAIQIRRIMAGDKTLGENRDVIEQAFAAHRIATTADLQAKLEAAEGRIEELVGLLTRAVADISTALIMTDGERLIGKWTAEYVAAINAHDAITTARATMGERDD